MGGCPHGDVFIDCWTTAHTHSRRHTPSHTHTHTHAHTPGDCDQLCALAGKCMLDFACLLVQSVHEHESAREPLSVWCRALSGVQTESAWSVCMAESQQDRKPLLSSQSSCAVNPVGPTTPRHACPSRLAVASMRPVIGPISISLKSL